MASSSSPENCRYYALCSTDLLEEAKNALGNRLISTTPIKSKRQIGVVLETDAITFEREISKQRWFLGEWEQIQLTIASKPPTKQYHVWKSGSALKTASKARPKSPLEQKISQKIAFVESHGLTKKDVVLGLTEIEVALLKKQGYTLKIAEVICCGSPDPQDTVEVFDPDKCREHLEYKTEPKKIAILDTGASSSVLRNTKKEHQANFALSTEEPLDTNGHGSHIYSIIEGSVAPGTIILIGKIYGGSNDDASLSSVHLGIKWAVRNDVDYICLASAPEAEIREDEDVMEKIRNTLLSYRGTLFVAAGNNPSQIFWPKWMRPKKYSIRSPTNIVMVGSKTHPKGEWSNFCFQDNKLYPSFGELIIRPCKGLSKKLMKGSRGRSYKGLDAGHDDWVMMAGTSQATAVCTALQTCVDPPAAQRMLLNNGKVFPCQKRTKQELRVYNLQRLLLPGFYFDH